MNSNSSSLKRVCPKCRVLIQSIVPNKSIDTAISECLTSIKKMMNEYRENVGSDNSNHNNCQVTESQDVDCWNDRYKENEMMCTSRMSSIKSPAIKGPFTQRLPQTNSQLFTVPSTSISAGIVNYVFNTNSLYDCSAPVVEKARSNRSTCLHCRTYIPLNELRVGVQILDDTYSNYVRWMHLTCVQGFNNTQSADNKILFSSLSQTNLRSFTDSEVALIVSLIS